MPDGQVHVNFFLLLSIFFFFEVNRCVVDRATVSMPVLFCGVQRGFVFENMQMNLLSGKLCLVMDWYAA